MWDYHVFLGCGSVVMVDSVLPNFGFSLRSAACFVENFCLYIHKGYSSIIFFSCDVFIWTTCQSNAGLISELRAIPFSSVFEELRRVSVVLFKRLVEFTHEAVFSKNFLYWEVSDY